jgi:hypothetical protein
MKTPIVPRETIDPSVLKTKRKCMHKGCKRICRPGQRDCRACHAADLRDRRKKDGVKRVELATEFQQIAQRITEFLIGRK